MKGPVVMALAIFVALAALAQAQTPATNLPHEKVSFESAKATAEAKAPKGLLTSHELVHQHDRLLYSFWFTESGKSGVKEVVVDATTGKVVKVKHESIRAEQQEKLKEAKAHR